MSFIIGLLSFVLVLVCIALIFLVLIQLPKKEAGVGVAFGGAATDALFGAGSGTVLTKATKYAAVAFFALAIIVGALQSRLKKTDSSFATAVTEAHNAASAAPAAQPEAQATPAGTPVETAPLMSQPTTSPAETSAPPTEAPAGK